MVGIPFCVGIVSLVLFGNYAPSVSSPEWLQILAREIQAACRDAGTQWMVVVCLLSYFAVFLFLGKRILPRERTKIAKETIALPASDLRPPTSISVFLAFFRGKIGNSNFWLAAFSALVLLRYAFDYANAAKSLQVVVLLTGIVIGRGIALWVNWGNSLKPEVASLKSELPLSRPAATLPPSDGEGAGVRGDPALNPQPLTLNKAQAILSILVLLLAVASLWHPERSMEYFYRGQQRWTGPWDNPNLFGLMMGVGTMLASGLLVSSPRAKVQSRTKAEPSTFDSQLSTINAVGRVTPCAPGNTGLVVGAEVTSRSPEALLTSCPPVNTQPSAFNYFHRFTTLVTRYASRLLLLGAAGLCGYGLLKSYSRGAWLGTALGLGFLLWKSFNHETHEIHESKNQTDCPLPACGHPLPVGRGEGWGEGRGAHGVTRPTFQFSCSSCSSCSSWLRRNWLPSSILILSLFVICFWQFRHTESPLARRLFSAGNVNDFSWRNRVAAWEGASRMMLDKPFAGFGWNKAEEVYSKQYRAARLEEAAAIQMNDYLMLGISVGTPALLCFLVYVGLIMWRGLVGRGSPLPAALAAEANGAHGVTRPTINPEFSTVAKAGALVLLIGFWFDGGLFKLPTAVVFWVLIELARRADIPVCQFGRLSSRPVQEHLARKHGTGKSHAPAGWKTCPTLALRWLAGLVAIFALGLTALHLITPQRVVSDRTLTLAREFIVPPKEKADFEYLAAKPIWSGQPLKDLLQHAHLANYNRTLVNWKLDDQLYREFVLSPEIEIQDLPSPRPSPHPMGRGWPPGRVRGAVVLNAQPSTDLNWRRPLWEFFYPRIRKESSLEAAAEIVIRNLRERMKITAGDGVGNSLRQYWQQGQASEREFQILCVAVLRSVGIPARLSAAAQAEFWNGAEWKLAALEVKTGR